MQLVLYSIHEKNLLLIKFARELKFFFISARKFLAIKLPIRF